MATLDRPNRFRHGQISRSAWRASVGDASNRLEREAGVSAPGASVRLFSERLTNMDFLEHLASVVEIVLGLIALHQYFRNWRHNKRKRDEGPYRDDEKRPD